MKLKADSNNTTGAVAQERLVRRCAAYNELHATEFTPETYDEERTRVPRLIAWDEGWEACEAAIRAVSGLFRKEADNLASFEQPRAQGAVIAYRDMSDKLDAIFPPPNSGILSPPSGVESNPKS